ncbi:DUF5995 family protein [Haliangium sp.]|uniref:DUF5995 family protein n=1 Tax=Haliangium sp. TaxID=2663208 RepID=UPI003D0C0FA0
MNTTPKPLPTTIDGVIARTDDILNLSRAGASRLGYFAALYKRVTITVRALLGKGYFDDDARMEHLDVTFANRYLAALDDYTSDGPGCTAPWRVAFDALANPKLLILQHLVIGMNAHIELDLGVAVAQVAPGNELASLYDDFNKINTLLATLSPLVEKEIGHLSPMIHLAEKVGEKLEKPIVDTGMMVARSTAWELAEKLAHASPEEQEHIIAERAREVGRWGKEIADPPFLAEAALRVIELAESNDVRAIIATLDKPDVIEFQGSPITT